jgi:hypothetical protein
VAVVGGYVLVADLNGGVRVVDLSVPTSPQEVGSYGGATLAEGVAVVGQLAYVANGWAGVIVLDVSNPAAPTLVGSSNPAGVARALALSNGTVAVADDNAGIALFDGCREVLFEDGLEALGTMAWSAVQP